MKIIVAVQRHRYFHDKRIRQKKERVCVLMRCMVAGGGIFVE
jgi:hypothetical protein